MDLEKMTSTFYRITDSHEVVPATDLLAWATDLEDDAKRQVALDELENGTKVSTVFLGVDMSHGLREGAPLVFETAVFGHDHFRVIDRHTTWAEALEGHSKAVKLFA